ncbi:MAG: methyltransferase domain-containing protein, partial [Actinomycetes bacterium]
MTRERYTHGHHESVLRSHTWRTIANSAAYLEPHLDVGLRILDVGCGPGTITAEFADRVGPDGSVVGIDASPDIVALATRTQPRDNVTFSVGDVYALAADDNSFDIVHAHQVMQHLADPVAALREMRRVCRPGGIVAARDADYSGSAWYP